MSLLSYYFLYFCVFLLASEGMPSQPRGDHDDQGIKALKPRHRQTRGDLEGGAFWSLGLSKIQPPALPYQLLGSC